MQIKYSKLGILKKILNKNAFNSKVLYTLNSKSIDFGYLNNSNLELFKYYTWIFFRDTTITISLNFTFFIEYFKYFINFIKLIQYFRINNISFYIFINHNLLIRMKTNKFINNQFIKYIQSKNINFIFYFKESSKFFTLNKQIPSLQIYFLNYKSILFLLYLFSN